MRAAASRQRGCGAWRGASALMLRPSQGLAGPRLRSGADWPPAASRLRAASALRHCGTAATRPVTAFSIFRRPPPRPAGPAPMAPLCTPRRNVAWGFSRNYWGRPPPPAPHPPTCASCDGMAMISVEATTHCITALIHSFLFISSLLPKLLPWVSPPAPR